MAFYDQGYFSCNSRESSPLTTFEIYGKSKPRKVSPLANGGANGGTVGRSKRQTKIPARFVDSNPLLKPVDLEHVSNLLWREFSSIGQLGKETWVYVPYSSPQDASASNFISLNIKSKRCSIKESIPPVLESLSLRYVFECSAFTADQGNSNLFKLYLYESEDGRPSICYLSNVQAQPNIQVYNEEETEIGVVDRFSGELVMNTMFNLLGKLNVDKILLQDATEIQYLEEKLITKMRLPLELTGKEEKSQGYYGKFGFQNTNSEAVRFRSLLTEMLCDEFMKTQLSETVLLDQRQKGHSKKSDLLKLQFMQPQELFRRALSFYNEHYSTVESTGITKPPSKRLRVGAKTAIAVPPYPKVKDLFAWFHDHRNDNAYTKRMHFLLCKSIEEANIVSDSLLFNLEKAKFFGKQLEQKM